MKNAWTTNPRRLRQRYRAALVSVAVAALVISTAACGSPSSSSGSSGGTSTTSAASTQARVDYLALARQGVAKTSRWWDEKLGWYDAILNDHHARPLAPLWDTNGLFEALDEIAIAQPTPGNLAAVTSFANGSERYWNRYLKPVPAYAAYLGDAKANETTWFDDNGWIGLAFLDAYKATSTTRYLSDAERAFNFIVAEGWDSQHGGGMWWNTAHPWLSGEALAVAADLAASLYQATGKSTYLSLADRYIGWANQHLLTAHGVYIPTADTPYPYLIEPMTPPPSTPSSSPTINFIGTCPKGRGGCKPGMAISKRPAGGSHPSTTTTKSVAMPHDGEGAMLAAITTLCESTGQQSWCTAAEKLAAAEILRLAPFSDGPQYDSVLVRGLLRLYAHDHNKRWYQFAVAIAKLIQTHAETAPGVYLRGWDGRAVPSSTFGALRTDAGSIAVFADLAMVTSTVADPSTP